MFSSHALQHKIIAGSIPSLFVLPMCGGFLHSPEKGRIRSKEIHSKLTIDLNLGVNSVSHTSDGHHVKHK